MKVLILLLATLVSNSSQVKILNREPDTGPAIPICNGLNDGKCVKASDVV